MMSSKRLQKELVKVNYTYTACYNNPLCRSLTL